MSDSYDPKYLPPDLSSLREMADGDEAFIKEIVAIFLTHSPGMLTSMKESAETGDYESLRFISHKFLSELSVLGILEAIPEVKKIEEEAKNKMIAFANVERAIKIINSGIEDLKKMI